MSFKSILRGVAAAVGFTAALAANAYTTNFDSVGDTETINFSTVYVGTSLTAEITWTLDAISATSATFSVSVKNTSADPSRLTAFGVEVFNPELTGASATDGWGTTINNANITNGFTNLDLCVWDGSNCQGGSNGGVGAGATESLTLTLSTAGNFLTDGITMSTFLARYQSIPTGSGSFSFESCTDNDCDKEPPLETPEPATLALLGLGLVGLGIARRRRA